MRSRRSIERLFTYAAWADKYDGLVHRTPLRNVTFAMPEPIGVMGLVCPEEAPAAWLRVAASRPPSPWATQSWSSPRRSTR